MRYLAVLSFAVPSVCGHMILATVLGPVISELGSFQKGTCEDLDEFVGLWAGLLTVSLCVCVCAYMCIHTHNKKRETEAA